MMPVHARYAETPAAGGTTPADDQAPHPPPPPPPRQEPADRPDGDPEPEADDPGPQPPDDATGSQMDFAAALAEVRVQWEVLRRMSIEASAGFVELVARVIEEAPEERVTKESVLVLLGELATCIRELHRAPNGTTPA